MDDDITSNPLVLKLVLSNYIIYIDPQDYDLPSSTPSIDPERYYVTSGDALLKTKQLIKDYSKLIESITIKKSIKYKKAIQFNIEQCQKLVEDLIKFKQNNCFLETEWNADRELLVIAKNPKNYS